MAPTEHELSVESVLAAFDDAHRHEAPPPGEGLRQRKKRLLRQRISNTATAMFLVHGFDRVTVAQIADACDISEPTMFKYFPTKESLFFDRVDASIDALAEALRDRSNTLYETVLHLLTAHPTVPTWPGMDDAWALQLFRRFCATIKESPALTAAQDGNLNHFVNVVSAALAARAKLSAHDPEVQLVAVVLLGITRIRALSAVAHVNDIETIDALTAVVSSDIRRAAAAARPTLDHFERTS